MGLIGLLIVVAIIALAGGGVWYFDRLNQYSDQEKTVQNIGQQKIREAEALKQKADQYNQEITKAANGDASTQKVSLDTPTWKKYRNEKYGFEVRYPSQANFLMDQRKTKKGIIDNFSVLLEQQHFSFQIEASPLQIVDGYGTDWKDLKGFFRFTGMPYHERKINNIIFYETDSSVSVDRSFYRILAVVHKDIFFYIVYDFPLTSRSQYEPLAEEIINSLLFF